MPTKIWKDIQCEHFAFKNFLFSYKKRYLEVKIWREIIYKKDQNIFLKNLKRDYISECISLEFND